MRLPGEPPYRIAGIPEGIISADDLDVTEEALEALARFETLRLALVKIATGPSDVSPPEIARCALGWPSHLWESGA